MQKITPFLWFDGQVEEALNFYTSVFKNSKIKDVRNHPDERPGHKGKVFTATFELEGVEFMILDGGPYYKIESPAISFFVKCKDQAEVDELWDKIAEEGTPSRCGWITDKYGVSWQIIPDILGKVSWRARSGRRATRHAGHDANGKIGCSQTGGCLL
jgi:predicted 3-demethylubiquinone-9 3-methyltransferase (glyoxalase superfamily)